MKLGYVWLVIVAGCSSFIVASDDSSDYQISPKKKIARKKHYAFKRKAKRCSRCAVSSHSDSINFHMHNHCFDFEIGMPCLDCKTINNESPLFTRVIDIIRHNQEFHAESEKWQCLACNARIYPDAFIKHFGRYTLNYHALSVFSGYEPDILLGCKKKSLHALRHEHKEKLLKEFTFLHTISHQPPHLLVEGVLGLKSLQNAQIVNR